MRRKNDNGTSENVDLLLMTQKYKAQSLSPYLIGMSVYLVENASYGNRKVPVVMLRVT